MITIRLSITIATGFLITIRFDMISLLWLPMERIQYFGYYGFIIGLGIMMTVCEFLLNFIKLIIIELKLFQLDNMIATGLN